MKFLFRFLSVTALMAFIYPALAYANSLNSIATRFEAALGSGSMLLAIGLVYLAGLATALTPCVYPMIAITVSIFGARESTRTEGALLSLSFILGIAALFTPLGIISALTGQIMGSALQNPIILIALALLFIVMAISMFGFWDMGLPPSMQNMLAKIGGSGYRGSFALGFVSGLIAAPCTGPVLTGLLTYVGTTQSVVFGAASLFAYSLGLGTLFFFVGTFAVSLPKSGAWLDWVKSFFGIVMMILAFYYLRTIIPFPKPEFRTQPWLLISGGMLILGILIGAIHLSFKYTSKIEKSRKLIGIILSVVGGLGLIFWMNALPASAIHHQIKWDENYELAMQDAKAKKQPIFIDFGAEWCGACEEFKHQVFSQSDVAQEASRFKTIYVDMTEMSEENEALLKSYKQPGLPFVLLIDSNGKEVKRFSGLVSKDEFLEALKKVK